VGDGGEEDAVDLDAIGSLRHKYETDIDAAAIAVYQFSLKTGATLSERKLAEMFGKTSRRWARGRIAQARNSATVEPTLVTASTAEAAEELDNGGTAMPVTSPFELSDRAGYLQAGNGC
jgi:hypothetical protein